MAYPSKQSRLSADLAAYLKGLEAGARLPSERELACQFGVARNTLRTALRKVEQDDLIVRTNQGTFLNSIATSQQEYPITVLLPCPDYFMACDFSSLYALRQLTVGARLAAQQYGSYVVTLPVSDSNDPDDINWSQLEHLNSRSRVLFCSDWFRLIFPLLRERGCRIGYLRGSTEEEFLTDVRSPWLVYRQWVRPSIIEQCIRYMYGLGAKTIAYVGSDAAFVSRSEPQFFHCLYSLGLRCFPEQFQVYSSRLPLSDRLQLLRKLYESLRFDGVILELNPYLEHDFPFDFYEATGIPPSVHLLTSVCDILRQPKVASFAHVYHEPILIPAYQLSSFLMSDDLGHRVIDSLYKIEPAETYIRDNHFPIGI